MVTVTMPLDDRLHGVYTAGTDRLGQEIRDARDRFVASDPGWARLRQGTRAILAVGSTLLLELGLARLVGQPAVLGMLMGAIVAMLMSTGIRDGQRDAIIRTAAVAPFAGAAGASLGVITAERHLLGLATFVVVSFVAVWVRRFGPRWFTLGFLCWQGFFFALLLRPPVAVLPFLLLAIAVSGVWVGLLLLTVLYDDPQAKLRRVVTALRARARSGIAAAAEVLDGRGDVGSVRQLRRHLVQLAEVALLLDGQLADARALPDGVSAGRLRRWTVDVEIGMDEVAGSVVEIARRRDELSSDLLEQVRQVLQSLGWADYPTAIVMARRLQSVEDSPLAAVPRLGAAAVFLLDTVAAWDDGGLGRSTTATDRDGPRLDGSRDPLDEDEFEEVVTLVGGNLPGSAALAQQTLTRPDAHRLSPSRMRLSTRQAVQAAVAAALAIVIGEAISAQRFYWAVIAAFVAFAGTATSGETVQKAFSRVGGTVLGLLAAVGLANVTDGHTAVAVAAILVCIFLAFFLQAISYGAMIFFITVMLGQLYTLLGTFSDELLLVRLAETAAGAAVGIVVSLVVLPTHSRATLKVARQAFLKALAELLEACGESLDGLPSARDLLTLTVQLEAAGRQLVRTRRALTKGRLFGNDRDGLRHRVSVLGTCGASARALAAAIPVGRTSPALAQAAKELAIEAHRLADAPELRRPPPLPPGTADLASRVRPLLDGAAGKNVAAAHAMRRLTDALALLVPRAVPTLHE
ncbi:hypothetical protein ABIB25_003180 [Nakamurella sp. UYEF19]|uniref:FUSC family protein n=1 Tax=Nakamurella sp. UYEF19 TaxID=1756392 RepID=UPI00339A9723